VSPAAAARQARRRRIAELIRREQVISQEQLVERLAAEGLTATQATVSRDLEELGAVKVRRGGVQAYALPDQVAGRDWPAERLQRVLRDWVVSVEAAGPLVVVKTPPGSAHLVAAALDAAERPELAGSIAGDDTLFLAVRDGALPAAAAEGLRALAGLEPAHV
jgi:transcriptional regulator of arginine metabolism